MSGFLDVSSKDPKTPKDRPERYKANQCEAVKNGDYVSVPLSTQTTIFLQFPKNPQEKLNTATKSLLLKYVLRPWDLGLGLGFTLEALIILTGCWGPLYYTSLQQGIPKTLFQLLRPLH